MSCRESEDLTPELQELAKTLHVKYDPAYEKRSIMLAIKRIKELEKQNSNYSWQINPDRMGS
jgi:hypothetical protein